MSRPSWAHSVERARLATLKSFEGRMEAAAASLEQIPANGKGAQRTLAEFAAEADIDLALLWQYREVWKWLDCDSRHVSRIGTYSIAREVMRAYDEVREFIAARDAAELPEGFTRWTLDAVRVALLGREPTNTGKLQQRAIEIGTDADPDEVTAAHVADEVTDAAEEAESIKRPVSSREAMSAAKKAAKKVEKRHAENVLTSPTYPNTDSDLADTEAIAGQLDTLHTIAFRAQHLVEALQEVPEWLARFAEAEVEVEPGKRQTLGELMRDTLREEKGAVLMAFDAATSSVGDEAERFVHEQERRVT